MSEAFNSVLKVEYVHWHTFRTRTETRIKIATWITDFYNVRRLHGVCGFKSPIDYERDYRANPRRGTGRIDRLHAARGVGMSSSPCTEAKRLV
ncbi:IS3 family transposase [Streptomyces mirabilis]|uniref:IS3 family transposase n=1 Tax=Streptomyces TaxID=1883 RepID=UPI000BE2D23E|nr:IS3 family transposase [Streptomyces sp. OK228]